MRDLLPFLPRAEGPRSASGFLASLIAVLVPTVMPHTSGSLAGFAHFMPKLKGLRTVIYHAPDLARAKAWYAEAFGLKPYFDQPFYVGFNVGGFELGLIPDGPANAVPAGVLAYWGVADVGATFAGLLKLGATAHEAPKEVGGDITVASVLDPFGNIIGLIDNPHFDPRAVQ